MPADKVIRFFHGNEADIDAKIRFCRYCGY